MYHHCKSKVFFCFRHVRYCVHVPAAFGSWVCMEGCLWNELELPVSSRQLLLVPPSLDTAFISARQLQAVATH